uniref:Protein YIPF n=1 Tax=Mola mola TaxID=94237 RepID=A0A3Q3X340_MOLML
MASPNDLRFQEFEEAAELLSADPGASTLSMSTSKPASTAGAQDVKLDLSEDEEGQEESSELLGGQKATGGFWTFEYYQSFFNVDTIQVLDRVRGSVMPLPGRNFIKHHLRNNPDLYGPFWICVTLVFSVAISGNLSTFLSEKGNPSFHYTPQFHRVTIAAVVIFMYAWLVPFGLWGFLTWRQGAERQIGGYSFLETVCVYGYSLFIYIPTSVLWIISFEWLRWTLILVAILISGSVLVLTFWPVVRDDTKVMAVATIVAIVALHTLLAIGCKVSELAMRQLFTFDNNQKLNCLFFLFHFSCTSSRQPLIYQHRLQQSLQFTQI